LEKDFGWSRGDIMVSFTIMAVGSGIAGPFIGKIVDKYSPKRVLPVSATIVFFEFYIP